MAYRQKGYNILIVDEHQVVIDGLKAILKFEKIIGSLQSATNVEEAVKKVIDSDINCVLMDINMPQINCQEATKIIRQLKPQIKVIIVSMLSDAPAIMKLLKSGADAFMIKDFGKNELLNAIQKVMLNEKYISSELNLDLYDHLGKYKNNYFNVSHLTFRENEIIQCIADGKSNQQIAEKLFLSTRTVNTHCKNIMAKLELKNTDALLKYAVENSFS